jgi:hypothetical protein
LLATARGDVLKVGLAAKPAFQMSYKGVVQLHKVQVVLGAQPTHDVPGDRAGARADFEDSLRSVTRANVTG